MLTLNNKLKIYRFTVKEPEYDNYRGFMVASTSIPNALEEVYKYVCFRNGELVRDIPYCLRSSNMTIECLGDFTATDAIPPILMADFYNA